MAEGFLSEAFRIAEFAGTLGPGIAVRMEADTGQTEGSAAASEFSGTVVGRSCGDSGKEGTIGRELPESFFEAGADSHSGVFTSFLALVAEGATLPVDVLGS
jgi:hypothetical protein